MAAQRLNAICCWILVAILFVLRDISVYLPVSNAIIPSPRWQILTILSTAYSRLWYTKSMHRSIGLWQSSLICFINWLYRSECTYFSSGNLHVSHCLCMCEDTRVWKCTDPLWGCRVLGCEETLKKAWRQKNRMKRENICALMAY